MPPTAIHDEKVKVLQAIRPFQKADFDNVVIRGQYATGFIDGEDGRRATGRKIMSIPPPMSKPTLPCASSSTTGAGPESLSTCGAENGSPNAPQRSPSSSKTLPAFSFQQQNKRNEPNILSLRIQPDEGTGLKINCKVPGPSSPIQPVKMDFRYGSYFGMSPPEAYERLIQDCILGDNTLFAREDEVFNSWRLLTPLLELLGCHKTGGLPQLRNRAPGGQRPLKS